MLKNFFKQIGKDGFSLDSKLSNGEKSLIFFQKAKECFRGVVITRLFFKSTSGLSFIGKGLRLKNGKKVHAGKTLSIGRNVQINAFCSKAIEFGNNVTIKDQVIINSLGVLSHIGEGLKIGNNVGISERTIIQVRGEIIIEDDVIIGPGCTFISENHKFDDPMLPIRIQGTNRIGIKIRKGVWIGANVTVLDGVEIGYNSIIAAGSIVNKDIMPNSIYAGVPAKFIKKR